VSVSTGCSLATQCATTQHCTLVSCLRQATCTLASCSNNSCSCLAQLLLFLHLKCVSAAACGGTHTCACASAPRLMAKLQHEAAHAAQPVAAHVHTLSDTHSGIPTQPDAPLLQLTARSRSAALLSPALHAAGRCQRCRVACVPSFCPGQHTKCDTVACVETSDSCGSPAQLGAYCGMPTRIQTTVGAGGGGRSGKLLFSTSGTSTAPSCHMLPQR
jgi:hypothetical protein